MKAELKFLKQSPEFWANVKLIGQKIEYTVRNTGQIKVADSKKIKKVYRELGLDSSRLFDAKGNTTVGDMVVEYFHYRADILHAVAKKNLMNVEEAKELFEKLRDKIKPKRDFPMNKQKGEKKGPEKFHK